MTVKIQFKSKWDGPVEFEPVFKTRDLKRLIAQNIEDRFENTTGKLARSIRVRQSGRGTAVTIKSNEPYALIQEFGGQVPERFPVRATAMRFEVEGATVFAKRAKSFTIRGEHYIEDAVDEWVDNVIGVKWKLDKTAKGKQEIQF